MKKAYFSLNYYLFSVLILFFFALFFEIYAEAQGIPLQQQPDTSVDATDFEITYDFEEGWGDWSANNGIWEVGTPNAGPGKAYRGAHCIGTGISGFYPEKKTSTLSSPIIKLPLNNPGTQIALTFIAYHSYDQPDWKHYNPNQATWYDSCILSVLDKATNRATVLSRYDGLSDFWYQSAYDLTPYAGKEIQLTFLHSDVQEYPEFYESTGFFMDNVSIKVKYPETLPQPIEKDLPWKQVAVSGPEPRREAAMTYDSKRGQTLLFGGWNGTQSFGDLWAWNGTQWTAINNTGPSPRYGAAMAYDANRDRVVLFGGTGASGVMGDLWEFDGTAWTEHPGNGVTKRSHSALAYDPNQKVVILFGGQDSLKRYNDSWKWDGSNWTPIASNGPAARASCGMVYNASAGAMLLYGGKDFTNYFSDTWQLVDNQWKNVPTTTLPVKRTAYNALAYDPVRNRALLFGGANADGVQGDTWEFDGTNWWYTSELGPYHRDGSAQAFDTKRNRLVVFGGGSSFENINAMGDTWEYQPLETLIATWNSPLAFMDEFTRLPGGFSGAPGGSLQIGEIPSKYGYSDGKGVVVTVQPNQLELMYFPEIIVGDNIVLLRVSVQTTAPGAAIALAALDASQDGSIATNIPANSQVYQDNYQKAVLVYSPPTKRFSPIIQVANIGNTVPVTVYLDNVEVFLLPRDKYRRFYSE